MRLFLALNIPETERAKLAEIQGCLPHGRVVHVDDLHITLVFLGNGTARQVDDLVELMSGLRFALPPIKFSGPGVFGGAQTRAAWLGVIPSRPLDALHRKLVRRAEEVGFGVPRRKYVPHTTLARFGPAGFGGTPLAAFFEVSSSMRFELFQPQTVILYQSVLGRAAPVYDALDAFPVSPL